MTDVFAVLIVFAVLSVVAYLGAWILDRKETRKLAIYAELAVRATDLDRRS